LISVRRRRLQDGRGFDIICITPWLSDPPEVVVVVVQDLIHCLAEPGLSDCRCQPARGSGSFFNTALASSFGSARCRRVKTASFYPVWETVQQTVTELHWVRYGQRGLHSGEK